MFKHNSSQKPSLNQVNGVKGASSLMKLAHIDLTAMCITIKVDAQCAAWCDKSHVGFNFVTKGQG